MTTKQDSAVRSAVIALLIAISAAIVGWPTCHGEFLSGDDQNLILDHNLVNHPSWSNAVRLASSVHGDLYQPLPMLSFQANYALAKSSPGELPPVSSLGFHLTNIGLHMLNSVLAFLLARRLAVCSQVGGLTGLLFACHPFAIESVAWINGRMILLATFFVLALLLLCSRARTDSRWSWKFGAFLLFGGSLLSKVILTVPVAAYLCDAHMNGKRARSNAVFYLLLLILGTAATWFSIHTTGSAAGDWDESEMTASAPVRMVLASRYYIENYFWPTGLAPWSPPPKIGPETSRAIIIAMMELGALAAFALALRRYSNTDFLGVLLFALLLFPFVMAATNRRQLAADRYMYLPIFGLHLAVSTIVFKAVAAFRKVGAQRIARGVGGLAFTVVVICFSEVDYRLAASWMNTTSRDARTVEVYPDDPDARAELARGFLFQKRTDEALRVATEARRRWPDHPRLAAQAGEALRRKGEFVAANREFQAALEKMPQHIGTLYRCGLTLEALGRLADARARFEYILTLDADYLPAITSLARLAEADNDSIKAAEFHLRALALRPHHVSSLRGLARIYIRQDDFGRATGLLETILHENPVDVDARLSLGAAKAGLKRYAEALAIFDSVIATDPSNIVARVNRAELLRRTGQAQTADREYRELHEAATQNMEAAIAVSEYYQTKQLFGEMIQLWQKRVDAEPGDLESHAWLAWSYTSAGRMPDALQAGQSIPRDSEAGAFVYWALALDALRRGDETRLLEMESALRWSRIRRYQTAKRRSIVTALSELPAEIRNRPAALFVLACALTIDGSNELARDSARQVADSKEAFHWREPAQKLLSQLGPASRPAGTN